MSSSLDFEPDELIKGTKYIVVRRLSGGGHGTIYLVRNRDLPPEKRFALKILNSELSENADLTARLLNEARLQACIEHPNVVAVHDAGMTDESPPRAYFLMERLRGHSLRSAIQQAGPSGLGLASIYGIGIQVCDALECAHERGAVHRDIKPDNIFIHTGMNEDLPAVTKVLDFGVAYFMGNAHRRTHEVAIGTPLYMSPEQFRGERPTARTDLYAVGLVLYEMTTGGKRPFAGRLLGELSDAHMHRTPPTPSSKVTFEIPAKLEALIMQLLEKDPRARPASARVVASRLREIKQQAELEYTLRPLEDANKTEETPLENILRMTRGAETNPTMATFAVNQNPTLPRTPKAKGDPGRSAPSDATDPGMYEAPPVEGRTLEDAPYGLLTTLQSTVHRGEHEPTARHPQRVEVAVGAPDRDAVTRSLPTAAPRSHANGDTLRMIEVRPNANRAAGHHALPDRSAETPILRDPSRAPAGVPSQITTGASMSLGSTMKPRMRATTMSAWLLYAAAAVCFVAVVVVGVRVVWEPPIARPVAASGAPAPAPSAAPLVTAQPPTLTSAEAPPRSVAPAPIASSETAIAGTSSVSPPPRVETSPSASTVAMGTARPQAAPAPSAKRATPRPASRRDDGIDLISDKP